MKTFKKVLALILIVAISISTVALADNSAESANDVQPRASAYIDSYSGSIKPTGNGNFKIVFSIVGTGTMTKIGALSICIYKNGTQVDSFSYNMTGRSGMMAYNTVAHADTETYSGVSGASYYARIAFYAKNSSGSDIKYYNTPTVVV